MSDFTPGPWDTFDDEIVCRRDDQHIADVPLCDGINPTEWQANMRLIAAAPDLLAALKEYVEWFGAVHGEDCPADDTCTCIGGSLNARVNAAIRKAEGR